MPELEVLSIEFDGHVATVWLDRPEARNAMGPAFWDDLTVAMTEVSADANIRARGGGGAGSALQRGT